MTDIGPKRFRLIFRGELEKGTDPEQARALFRERFRVDEKKLDHCFSGRKVALRSKLPETEAFRLQAELQAQGLITTIEAARDKTSAPPPEEARVAPIATANTEARPASSPKPEPEPEPNPNPNPNGTACLHCHARINPDALHCPYCGQRQQDSGGIWPWLAGVALLLLVAVPLTATFLVPLVQQSQTASRVDSALQQGQATAEQVRAFMDRTGFRPNSNLDAGLAAPAKLAKPPLATISLSRGALITLRFQPELSRLGNKTILFVPRFDNRGNATWVCRPGTLAAARLPERCRPDEASEQAPPSSPGGPATPDRPGSFGDDGVARRVIGEEIRSSRSLRARMLAFYQQRGRWPANNAALELAAPARLGTSAVREIRVQPDGQLALTFINSLTGRGQTNTLVLYHRDGDWRCRSDMPASVLPAQCQRDPDGPR